MISTSFVNSCAWDVGPGRRWRSRGYLPHSDDPQATQIVTFRLADAMPAGLLARWRAEALVLRVDPEPETRARVTLRKRIDEWLDRGLGSCFLRQLAIAKTVEDAFLTFDQERYRLLAWIVMPNHVPVVLQPQVPWTLEKIVHSWKSFTAHRANRILQRSGPGAPPSRRLRGPVSGLRAFGPASEGSPYP